MLTSPLLTRLVHILITQNRGWVIATMVVKVGITVLYVASSLLMICRLTSDY